MCDKRLKVWAGAGAADDSEFGGAAGKKELYSELLYTLQVSFQTHFSNEHMCP